MTPLVLKPIPPTTKNPALVSRSDGSGGLEMVDGWARTECGDALRAGRILCGLSLRAAADALGLEVVALSGLERGQYAITAEELGRALVRLARVARAPVARCERPGVGKRGGQLKDKCANPLPCLYHDDPDSPHVATPPPPEKGGA